MASITITSTAAQDTRLGPAFGDKLGLKDGAGNPRNATTAEVKQWIIDCLAAVVRNYEFEQQKVAITTTTFTPT